DATIDRVRPATNIVIDHRRVSAGLVRGDATQLEQVVRNLLDNAIRHAEETVTVSLADDGSTVELVVANDGDTISADDSERIFERFYRTQQARDRHSGGTGLGLAITKAILTLHQATVIATPTNPGTTITARFAAVDDTPSL
ncbi:MAG: sensor histidine kinase, partial [Acidimicrobiales bacterium]